MSKIKLFKIGELSDGTQRFQSQLSIGNDVADAVMGIDGIMKIWRYGDNGVGFYPYEKHYEIVSKKSDMNVQPL